jgi:poly-gamma-glutamate capsule biosynthesis protein CapA/YwtB (metallophosphatase superfamily)
VRSFFTLAVSIGVLAGCAATGPRPAAPAVPPAQAGPAPLQRGGALAPSAAPAAEPVRTLARTTLGAVGDVLMHEAVKRSAEAHARDAADGGYAWLYAPIADLLAEPGLTFANLETPVAPAAGAGTREYVFNAPPEAIAALVHAGIDVVSVANNHAFDQGRTGFEETLRRVGEAGLAAVGAGPEGRAAGPVRLESGGLTVAFLGYAAFFNQEGNACPRAAPAAPPCVQVALLDRARIVEEVRAAAAGSDAVVVSLHWGTEYEGQPRAEDVELAHRLVEAGALVVLGHHPHVLQPVELYRAEDGRVGVIAYSLGNFVSNQSRGYVFGVTPEKAAATRDGVLLRVALARRDYGRGITRVEVDGADAVPLWTENDTAEIDRRREPARRPAIRVVAVDRALAEVRAELARLADPLPAAERDRYVALRRREALLVARRAAVAALVGEDLVRAVPPSPAPLRGAAEVRGQAPSPAPQSGAAEVRG